MTLQQTLDTAAEVPAALAAFLRGIERRAVVFAELQCGDAAQGARALVAAMAAFRRIAQTTAIADWPRMFWTLLLAAPLLRVEPLAPHWRDNFAPLARMGRGPRAAVLLRMVAGLGESEAAAVLAIAPATYRLALQRALPRRADGSADGETWLALGDDARRAIRDLPTERLAALARQREAAIIGAGASAASYASARDHRPQRRWLAWLWAGVGLCALAFVATFYLPDRLASRDGEPRIRSEPLPPAETPAARYDSATALLTETDFELLDDVAGERITRDVAFYAWLDARETAVATELPPALDATSAEPSAPETSDAP